MPKQDIFNKLSELNVGVAQSQPTEFNELPFINFSITQNDVELDLDNEINSQNIEVQIDIWAEDSVSASELLRQVEEKMREELYLMTYSADVPNVGNIYHIVTRFNTKR
jgi:hypothetical protein